MCATKNGCDCDTPVDIINAITLFCTAGLTQGEQKQTCIESCAAYRIALCSSKVKLLSLVNMFHDKLAALQIIDVTEAQC